MKVKLSFLIAVLIVVLSATAVFAGMFYTDDNNFHDFSMMYTSARDCFGVYGIFKENYTFLENNDAAAAYYSALQYPNVGGPVPNNHMSIGMKKRQGGSWQKYVENSDRSGDINRYEYSTLAYKSNMFLLIAGGDVSQEEDPESLIPEKRNWSGYVYATCVENVTSPPDDISSTFYSIPINDGESASTQARAYVVFESISSDSMDSNVSSGSISDATSYVWEEYKIKSISCKKSARKKTKYLSGTRAYPFLKPLFYGSVSNAIYESEFSYIKKIYKGWCKNPVTVEVKGCSGIKINKL